MLIKTRRHCGKLSFSYTFTGPHVSHAMSMGCNCRELLPADADIEVMWMQALHCADAWEASHYPHHLPAELHREPPAERLQGLQKLRTAAACHEAAGWELHQHSAVSVELQAIRLILQTFARFECALSCFSPKDQANSLVPIRCRWLCVLSSATCTVLSEDGVTGLQGSGQSRLSESTCTSSPLPRQPLRHATRLWQSRDILGWQDQHT